MRSSPIIRSDDLRTENRYRMLSTLRSAGPCTSAQIRSLTGLSAAAVSTLSAQMIDQGILISEREAPAGQKIARGRPKSRLSTRPDCAHAVTLSVTIDRMQTKLIDYAGGVLQSDDHVVDTQALSLKSLIAEISQCIERVCKHDSDVELRHIGVAFQGLIEHDTGTLLWSPIIQHQNVPVGQMLQDHFDVDISVNNDCVPISQALHLQHADRLGGTFATALFSYGVGLALYINGQPFAGSRTSALEIGHLCFISEGALCRCGKRGCIEAYTADYAIQRRINNSDDEQLGTGRVTRKVMQGLAAKAEAGDEKSVQAFRDAGAAMGHGLASLFTLLDPMPVALVVRNDDVLVLMRDGIQKSLDTQLQSHVECKSLLHNFEDPAPLLHAGLVHDGLSRIDRKMADQTPDSVKTA